MLLSMDTTMDNEMRADEFIELEQYRKLVRTHIDMRRYRTALFWAEKVAVLSQYDPVDIYWQAQCMFMLAEYHRAAHVIEQHGYEKTHLLCHYLAAESHFEAKDYQESMDLLNTFDLDFLNSTEFGNDESAYGTMFAGLSDSSRPTKSEAMASICFLRGKVLEAQDNRILAIDCYVQALHWSVYCTEALDALVQHEMLLMTEEEVLISHLPVDQQCTDAEAKILLKLYKSKLKKYYETSAAAVGGGPQTSSSSSSSAVNRNTIQTIIENTGKIVTDRSNIEVKRGAKETSKFFSPIQQNKPANIYNELKTTPSYSIHASLSKAGTPTRASVGSAGNASIKQNNDRNRNKDLVLSRTAMSLSTAFDRLTGSIDMLSAQAETYFYNSEYKKCSNLLEKILKDDPYHNGALTVYIGTLMEMKEHNKMFCIAHKLVDLYSDQAISWYAVGCYYDLIGKSDPARRYLSKATAIDRLFGPAWLAYGHSFAKENEHDQAMAAYFKATQLMRGCHLPLLYIGVECGLTKNLELAEKFFYQAMSVAPLDVFVLHELGVIKFEYDCYKEAEDILRATYEMVKKMAEDNDETISTRWEPLLNNLGHACRKNRKYDEALSYHKQALVLKPQNAPTFTAIGFVHALKGELDKAVEYFHRSLALRRDNIVTSTLLKSCLEDLMEDSMLMDDQTTVTDPFSNRPIGMGLTCMKITFDDDSNQSQSSEVVDHSIDMSMDD